MTLVVDASVVVSALADGGPVGTWSESLLGTTDLAAPHLMPVEVANILRRAARTGELTPDTASLAHGDMLDLRVALLPYEPFAERVWSLRDNLSAYDAWCVAIAEALDSDVATLDVRLSRAPGVACGFVLPP